MQRSYRVFIVVVVLALASHAQTVPPAEPEIQDNSFLIEEAYNQEFGVVQHISTFIRLWNSGDWVYSFTQEWPMPGDPRHQLSVTAAAVRRGDFPSQGAGFGDLYLNYRYQLIGSGETRLAFSPRLSLLLPTGDSALDAVSEERACKRICPSATRSSPNSSHIGTQAPPWYLTRATTRATGRRPSAIT